MIIFGGGGVVCMLTGGLGNVVVNSGNRLAAVGTVALPLPNCGCVCDAPPPDAPIGGAEIAADPTGGGGNTGTNVGNVAEEPARKVKMLVTDLPVPPGVVTLTITDFGLDAGNGLMVISVSLVTVTAAGGIATLPNDTAVAPVKPLPWIATE